MRPGPEELAALQSSITGRMLAGDDIIVVSPAGLSGTRTLLENNEERLRKKFSAAFLRDANDACKTHMVSEAEEKFGKILEAAEKNNMNSYIAAGRSGFLGALWVLAEASGCGLTLDLRRVPILQYTVEICEELGEHPYMLSSEGSFLFSMPSGEGFVSELRSLGIFAAVCGKANRTNDRLLLSGEIVRYLDKPPKELRPGGTGGQTLVSQMGHPGQTLCPNEESIK